MSFFSKYCQLYDLKNLPSKYMYLKAMIKVLSLNLE